MLVMSSIFLTIERSLFKFCGSIFSCTLPAIQLGQEMVRTRETDKAKLYVGKLIVPLPATIYIDISLRTRTLFIYLIIVIFTIKK